MTIALFSVPGARWMPGEPQDDQADNPSLTFSLPRRRASRVTSGVADRFHCLSLCDQPRALTHGSRTSSMQVHPCVLVGIAPLRAVRRNNAFSSWFSARWAQYARSRQPGEGLGRDPIPHHPRLALTMRNSRRLWGDKTETRPVRFAMFHVKHRRRREHPPPADRETGKPITPLGAWAD